MQNRPTNRLRFYQLSLRRLLVLTTLAAVGVWLALWRIGQITPEHGQKFVTPAEQRVLEAIQQQLALSHASPGKFVLM